jgi:superfamily II DNA helicase RecQ
MNATVRGRQKQYHFALAKTNNTQIKLKEEQKDAIRQMVNGRDVKSLIYQLLPSMFDYINSRKINISAVWPETIIIVISTLNALMGDQIDKLKTDRGVKAVVLILYAMPMMIMIKK